MRLSIHQPDFFPWLGFFHKISQSERFVVFDHVQAPRGKSWLTRNRILLNGEPRWLTLPIQRSGLQAITDLEINYSTNFERKHLGTIRQAYAKARFFDEVFPIVSDLYAHHPAKVLDFNLLVIREFCSRMRLAPEFVHSSALIKEEPNLRGLGANELVLRLCLSAGGTFYISGTGCLDFIEPETFSCEGIDFWFQDFDPPEYPQVHGSPFVSHMSVLDALFNLGFDQTAKLLRSPMLIAPGKYFERIKDND